MDIASLEPLAGGWSGETFVARVGGPDGDGAGDGTTGERQVVRIYARRPDRAEVDAALLHLVRDLVPVADVLEVRAPADGVPALLVTSFLPGVRGDLLLPDLSADARAVVGRHVGDLVGVLGGMPTLRAGELVGPDLLIEPRDLDDDGLPGWVESHLPALAHWTVEERAGLVEVAEDAAALLDTVRRCCLVHSDLNPKNLLLDPVTLEVTGLVDWEYAHSGHPFTDLGNVLRFERDPVYVEAVLAAYQRRRGTAPDEALALARAADLGALVDLAARRAANPVAARAHDLLLDIARRRDAGFDTPRTGA